jgi:glycosidase
VPTSLSDSQVSQAIAGARSAAGSQGSKTVIVNGQPRTVPYPYPSPVDWRDRWIYFLLVDRFNNPGSAPRGVWNRRFDFRQGGTLAGVTAQLDYLEELGVGALWLSPVLKNSRPDWRYNYHGYGAQDFINLDERLAGDGTRAGAERELTELVEQAHARGILVILDVVLNHAGRIFDYVRGGVTVTEFSDPDVMNGALGTEPPVRWLNGFGFPRADWQDSIPAGQPLSPDDAVYPSDLRQHVFFRRRGTKLTDDPGLTGFVRGDFGEFRQLVLEYDATAVGQEGARASHGPMPVLSILVRAYSYLIARYDLDGLRIDTAKYVSAAHLERFGNAIREFGQTIGKQNLFTFGEIYDDEETIAQFVGRNSSEPQSFGIDAALDFPLFYVLPSIAKGFGAIEDLRRVFVRRKEVERELLSSHGEAGRYFVSFLDNHDQSQRFAHPATPSRQLTLGLACLFCLQGIPALYYGTEQGLSGTVRADGAPDLSSNESTREAFWGRPGGFDQQSETFAAVRALARLRAAEPALCAGRLYFRELSGNGRDFGQSAGPGGVIAFSRIISDREVTVVANCNTTRRFTGFVLQDPDLNRTPRRMTVAYSNAGTTGSDLVRWIPLARFFDDSAQTGEGEAAGLYVGLDPMEVQVLVPAAS